MTTRLHKVAVHRSTTAGVTAMELASNHSFPRHSHDEYGIGVILSGAQRSWSGVGPVESFPGDVITTNPGEVHDGHPISGAIRSWRIIYFDPQALAQHLVHDGVREIEFVSPSIRDPTLGPWVNLLFDRLRCKAAELGIEEIVIHLVQRLTTISTGRRTRDRRKCSPLIVRVRERIDDDPSNSISLAELAALSGASRYRIVRAFAREMGVTPYAYVIQRRVELARQLLVRGETLAVAAQRAGFSDQSHLTRAFTRQFGISPGRYLAASASRRPTRTTEP
jgi:AraC-like DNA-binding protein